MAKKYPLEKSDHQWREQLTGPQFEICRKKGTERAGSGEYDREKSSGVYHCVCCENDLFSSAAKFDSGTGWPSYWQPTRDDAVELISDRKFFRQRTEVVCSQCGSHLGHVFDDGPPPTGKRYCINSVALRLNPNDSAD